MEKIVTDKSILVGDEKLVKKSQWIPLTEMNTDIKILTHKMFDDAINSYKNGSAANTDNKKAV